MNKYEMMDLTENEQIRDDGFNWKINKYEMMDLTENEQIRDDGFNWKWTNTRWWI